MDGQLEISKTNKEKYQIIYKTVKICKSYIILNNNNKLCYNEDINHISNNASESFNNYLKKLFYKKPSLYELIYHLKREESLSYNKYKRKIEGESELIDEKCDKNDIIDLWYKCLLELNKL
ncbi:hypothetical protein H8356DRAFT_1345601 [Neocallimastix lanati (nom. inval.)]|nr:hypothetical protein H8356DRAFT_1345601 [Neocallimastix sp. JGI-2020a]